MPAEFDSQRDEEFIRREEEREQYYGVRYESVLDELKQIRKDQGTMFKHFESIENRFDTLEKKVDDTKAASEQAHKEILERLERLEQNMK